GCAVVATDCPSGPREILDQEKFGMLARPEDPMALANAIIRCIDKKWEHSNLVARANEFSLEKAAKDYDDLFVSAAAR
ncbi:MAG: hypothetical protein R3245_12385, partial [Kiloniellales bacterium]|nr:hypothetical protein [Kiloniellales bacterium]